MARCLHACSCMKICLQREKNKGEEVTFALFTSHSTLVPVLTSNKPSERLSIEEGFDVALVWRAVEVWVEREHEELVGEWLAVVKAKQESVQQQAAC